MNVLSFRVMSVSVVIVAMAFGAACSAESAGTKSTTGAGASMESTTRDGTAVVGSATSESTAFDVSNDLRVDVLAALTSDVFVPGYQQMAAGAATLLADIETLCVEPDDPAALRTAQESWSVTRGLWLRTRAFRFGPATTLRTMSTVDFPIDSSKIDALLTGEEILTEESLDALGSDQRGLGGIEYVLFGPASLDEQSCSYLRSAAMLVADASTKVLDGWTVSSDGAQSFADQITKTGNGGMYSTEHEAYEDLVNSMIFALADVADAGIGRASGDVTGTPVPEEVDAGRARRAKQDAIDIIAGVVTIFDGASAGAGLRAVVVSISNETATAMDAEFAAAIAALDALTSPLAESTDPAGAHTAYVALKQAQVTLRAEIASLLGVTLTFGDADGDS